MDTPADVKRMRLRRAGSCSGCQAALPAGTDGGWHAATRSVWCRACIEPAPPHEPDFGVAGASAQREHERRAAARELRVRERHPRLGGLLLALAGEPQHQRAWATGSSGEQAVAAGLEGLDDVLVLHDRRMRGTDGRLARGNLDHLVVAPSGVWVVDAKQYAGSLEVRRAGGLLSPRVEQLWIAGRDRTRLLAGVHAQGVAIVGRRGLRKLLRQDGPLDADDRTAVARWLAQRLPPA